MLADPITQVKPTHDINVTFDGKTVVPDKIPPMIVGQTVRYVNAYGQGEISIEFPDGSPYLQGKTTNTSVPGGVILTLVSDSASSTNGVFTSRCYLILDGTKYGWSSEYPEAGGDHRVGQP